MARLLALVAAVGCDRPVVVRQPVVPLVLMALVLAVLVLLLLTLGVLMLAQMLADKVSDEKQRRYRIIGIDNLGATVRSPSSLYRKTLY